MNRWGSRRRVFYRDLYRDFYNNYVLGDFRQNWSNMGPNRSGMPPEHSQTRLGHFWKKSFFVKNLEKRPKSHETSMGRKTVFFLGNHKNKNDVHRHDSNFGGRMAFPSSIWSPFVKKRVLAKNIDFACNWCACTRVLCMHKILVHA